GFPRNCRRDRPARSSSARSRRRRRWSSNAPLGRAALAECRYAEHLTVRARTFLVVFGLAALLQVAASARAQEPATTPSPKELWEAYPLEPSQAPATATPSAEFS